MNLNYILRSFPVKSDFAKVFQKTKYYALIVSLFLITEMQAQTTFTSVQSGNYSDPETWGTSTAPTSDDHVVISTGNTVTLDDLLTAQNVSVSGTLKGSVDSPDFIVNGNLTVNSGGLIDGIYYFTTSWGGFNKAIQLIVKGNITNNGRIDLSDGASYLAEGVLKLNGSTVQTVSGLGTFGGTIYTDDNANNGAVINQLVIDNSSTATPNVIWTFNNIKIKGALTLTNARVDLGTNKMTIGNYNSASLICSSGNGFLNGTIGRWYGQYDGGFPVIAAGVDFNEARVLYPFINTAGENRSAFITRTDGDSNSSVSGELSVSYYNSTGVSSGFSIPDGSYTVTDIFEGAWAIAKDAAYNFPSGSHSIAFYASNAYMIKNGNSRIFKVDETTVGSHRTGTTTPLAIRTGLNTADLGNTFQIGYNSALDTPVTSTQSGNWNTASTWSNNAVPTCNDIVTLLSGHTVTVDAAASSGGVTISSGATLISDSGSLTIGCTNNNASFTNRGTYTINSGTLTVKGNVAHTAGSTFNQNGGDIIVDGNNNGDGATSSELNLFQISTSSLNLAAGKITIVDPAVVNTSLITTHSITSIAPCTGFFCWNGNHIYLDSTDNIALGQIVVGTGIPVGTKVVEIDAANNRIYTNPTLPLTGLGLPLDISFYSINGSPHAFIYNANENVVAGENHTFQLGDGISTDKSIITSTGFNCNFRKANGVLSLNNLIVDALDPTDRFVTLDNEGSNTVVLSVRNDFSVIQGKVKGSGVNAYCAGNIINNGEMNMSNTTYLGVYENGSFEPTTKPQTISGSGSAFVTNLYINNISAEGVTLTTSVSAESSLNMYNGILHTSANMLNIGSASMEYDGTILGDFGATCYIDGPVTKTIGGGKTAGNLTEFDSPFFFPVGKSSYAPIWVAVTTQAGFGVPGTKLSVEAFETNSGTASTNISNLSQTRWEVAKIGGDFSNFNIRIGNDALAENNIIVQAESANGVYDNDFGITATFTEGTPNTLTSNTEPLPFSDFKGFFSSSRQAECSVIVPGSTVASETNICNGKPVTLSLENIIPGEGISFQWQSSTDGIDYTDFDGETGKTAVVSPLTNTHYRCNVSCSFSSSTVASTPVEITLDNTIVSTEGTTICLESTNTATLSATSSAGDVKWYDAAVGGNTLATGDTFTTPALTETTTFYAGTESATAGTAGFIYDGSGYGTGGANRGLQFDLSNSIILNTVKVYPVQTPDSGAAAPITVEVFQNGVPVLGTTAVTFTPNTFESWSSPTTAQVVTLNFAIPAGNDYSLLVTGGISYSNQLAYSSFWPSPYPATSGAVTLKGGIDNGYVDSNYNYFYDWNITEVCSSARVAVTATVETTDCNLSNPTISDNLIKAVVYPNPYRNTFSIDIDTNDASDVSVKVYDMLGRIIESKEVDFENLKSTTFGNGYPAGVYNVIVTQENHSKSLRVVKQ